MVSTLRNLLPDSVLLKTISLQDVFSILESKTAVSRVQTSGGTFIFEVTEQTFCLKP